MNDFLHMGSRAAGISSFAPTVATGSQKAQLRHLAQTAQQAIEALAAGTVPDEVLSKLARLPQEQRAVVLRGIGRAPGFAELSPEVQAAFGPAQ